MNKEKPLDFERISYFFMIIISIVIWIFFFSICKSDDIRIKPERGETLTDEWFVNNTDETVSLPNSFTIKEGNSLRLSCILPTDTSSDKAVFYNCSYMTNRVYIDDEKIWSFAEFPTMPFGTMRGSAYAIIPMNEKYAGKTLTIEFVNNYNDLTSSFGSVEYGYRGEFKLLLLWDNLWRVGYFIVMATMSVISFFMGINHLVNLKEKSKMSFLYFSVMSFCVGLWILIDPCLAQFVTSKTTVVQYISFAVLILVGSSYSGFCSALFKKNKTIFGSLKYVGYVMLLLMTIFYVFSIFDPTDFILPIIIYACSYIIVSIIFTIRLKQEYSYYAYIILIGSLVLIAGVIGTAVAFVTNPLQNNSSIYFVSSYGFFVIMLFALMILDENKMVRASISAEMFEKMAFTDVLTGLNNRAAFERELDNIEHCSNNEMLVELYIADLNNLKKVNDTQGHEYGDKLIITMAKCILSSFSDCGKCFRLGGDEFAILIINGDMPSETILELLQKNVEIEHIKSGIEISFAIGYSKVNFPMENPKLDISLFREADQAMYQNKIQMKKQLL